MRYTHANSNINSYRAISSFKNINMLILYNVIFLIIIQAII